MAKISWKTEEDVLEELKKAKSDEMSRECQKRIIEGFSVDGEHYSYNQDNQINFQDTYQLFLNNMITEIGWNVYVNGEKTRKILNKEKFQKVYLAGVKHKVDTMNRLNDVLIPRINSAESKEVIARIYWDEGLEMDELELDTGNEIDKRIDTVTKTAKDAKDSTLTTMMALMQISSMIK